MANTIITIKSSGSVGNTPVSLQPGELAINYADGKLYYGDQTTNPVLFDVITDPAGLDGEIQFNDSGVFGASAGLSFNKTNEILTVTNLTVGTLNVVPGFASVYIHANSAFDQANTSEILAQAAFDQANTATSASIDLFARDRANAAYDQANTATQYATSAGVYANAAFLTSNTKVSKSGDTMTGFLTLHADPSNDLHAATKQYVDTVASASLHYHDPVRVESPVALTATYNNGTSGVGATLTNSGTQAALVIDGITLSLNDRVLVYNQTNPAHNGVYYVSDVGSVSTNWVLTRTTDTDSYGASDPTALGTGDAFYVKEGNTGAGELYVMTTEGTITFGTTGILFSQISSAQIYSAGSGLSLDGVVFSHADTSSQASVNNSGTTYIQDITLDEFGHITAIGSAALPTYDNYVSWTAADDDGTTFTITSGDTLTFDEGAVIDVNFTADDVLTFSHKDVTRTDTSSTASPGYGGTFNVVDSITTSSQGHITAVNLKTVTMPSVDDTNTTYTVSTEPGDNAYSEKIRLTGSDASTDDIILAVGQTGTTYGLTISEFGDTISFAHADTSSQSSVNNSDGTVIQDITLDEFGHLTAIGSVDLDGRYYTETEADNRFVNVSGDTMTGALTIDGTSTDTSPILNLQSGNGATTFNDGAQIRFGYNNTNDFAHFIHTRHNSNNANNAIDFYVSDGTADNSVTSGSVHTMSLVSGNVGIGTTSPDSKFHIYETGKSVDTVTAKIVADYDRISFFDYELYSPNLGRTAFIRLKKSRGTASSPALVGASDVTARIGSMAYDGEKFVDNALIRTVMDGAAALNNMPGRIEFYTTPTGTGVLSLKMVIKESGNVGIGTATPAFSLDVNGTGRATDFRANIFYDTNDTAYYLDPANSTTSALLAGNVGIGTTSPVGKLEVVGDVIQQSYVTGTGSYLFISKKARGTISAPSVILNGDVVGGLISGGYDGSTYRYTSAVVFVADGTVSSGVVPMAIRFSTGTTTTYSERMRITSTGNVGIGTTAPSQKLHVVGTGYATTDFRAPIFYDSDNTAYYVDPANSTTSAILAGNVGIGTTPGSKLQVEGDVRATQFRLASTGVIDDSTATTTATTQVAIDSWSATTYGGGKVIIEAKDGVNRHITELLVTHDGTTAIATEYGVVHTAGQLATYDVDISGGNVRILATPASTNSTSFKVMRTTMFA